MPADMPTEDEIIERDDTGYLTETAYYHTQEPTIATLPGPTPNSTHEVRVWPETGYLAAVDLTPALGYSGKSSVIYHCSDDCYYDVPEGSRVRLISDEDLEHLLENRRGKGDCEHLVGLTAANALTDFATPESRRKERRRQNRTRRSRTGKERRGATQKPNAKPEQQNQQQDKIQELEADLAYYKKELGHAEQQLDLAQDLLLVYRERLDKLIGLST